MLRAFVSTLIFEHAAGHGWLVDPVSKNDLSFQARDNHPAGMPTDFQYCPSCCANGNNAAGHLDTPAASCGANSDEFARGLDVWQKWYDAAGIAVPVLTPGSDIRIRAEMNADHGGQAWFMIACGSVVSENLNWTLLERSASDRGQHFLPSNPGIYAWQVQSAGLFTNAYYHVPASFSCPTGEAVGRWLWKTGNTCNDINNVGRNTETFQRSENEAIGLDRATCAPGQKPETFISCVSYKVTGSSQPTPTSAPTPTQQPTPAPPTPQSSPAPPTPAPTPPPATGGSCCWGGCGGNCNGGEWCHQSRGNCEGSCGGNYCPASLVGSAAEIKGGHRVSRRPLKRRSSLKTARKH